MPIRYTSRRIRQFIVHRILRVDDTPHRIAMGAGIGMFMAWTPLIGLHMTLSLVLGFLLRANKAVAVAAVWASNPLTMAPMLWSGFKLGELMLGRSYHWRQFQDAINAAVSSDSSLLQTLESWWHAVWPVLPPLALGCTTIGVFAAAACYVLTLWGVKAHRRRHAHLEPLAIKIASVVKSPAE